MALNNKSELRKQYLDKRKALAPADCQRDSALMLLRAATAIEQSLPVEFGPPTTIKPPHEAAGEVLLELGRFAEAEAEFRLTLARTPRRTMALLGLARAAKGQGKPDEAARTYAELVEIWKRADDGIAEVAEARAGARP